MANYIAQGRTNYFAVKDAEAFLADIAKCNVQVISRETESGETLYGFLDNEEGEGIDWFAWSADDDHPDEPEMTWGEFFKTHLADGWVAVILNIGSEKYRFLNGEATGYNNKGEEKFISINDFVDNFQDLGNFLTPASY